MGQGLSTKVDTMPTTVATYPDYKESVEQLVEQHRKLRDGNLHLAVYLAPPHRAKHDVYLFEIIDDFGGGRIDPDKKLFSFSYGSTPGFPLPPGVSLWMIVTNPAELETAIRENWKQIGELKKAQGDGNALVVYADAKGKRLWNKIK